ncbi:MAG: 30S ribosomal protein S1, partial [Clostridiales bacterium]|nr:30S ribosomal protein S1 [Clostridiales bacterium]
AADDKAPESTVGAAPGEDSEKPSSDAADIASQYEAGVSPEVAEYIAPDVAARMTPENTASSASDSQETEQTETQSPQEEPQSEAAAKPEDEQKDEAPKAEPSFMDQVAASMTRIRSGQTLTGKVVQISDDEVCVNIGYKSDGLIKLADLVDENLELGDDIEVEIIKVNDGEGNVILSQRNIVNRKLWEEIKAKYEAGEFVDAVGKEAVKGGLLANIDGVRAFIPASHLSQRYVEKISQFVGQPMKLKIIEIDDAKKRVVASRKEVIAAENAAKKEELWSKLEAGTVVKGIVRRFATFGAFVDLGGIDGLIHITDLSWNRSAQPQDVLKTGEEIDVKILSLDPERERIQLGYKQLQPRPWDNVVEKYPVGAIMTRKVVRVRPFGAFVEMEPGVDGLVHISQVAMTRVNKVEDVVNPGQEVNVKILSVDPEAKRISLSIREAMEETIFEAPQSIPGEHDELSFNEAAYENENMPDTDVAAAFRRAAEAVSDRGEEVSEAVQEATQQPEEADQKQQEPVQEQEADQQQEEPVQQSEEADQQQEEPVQEQEKPVQQPEAEDTPEKKGVPQPPEPYQPAENAEGSEKIEEGEMEIAEAAPSPIEGDD